MNSNVIEQLFKRQFEIPRIRNGQRHEFNTLINEEVKLFTKYLRNERKTWVPRIPELNYCNRLNYFCLKFKY